MRNDKNKAKELLTYYLRLLATRGSFNWDSDNQVEVEAIVDHIIEAAVEEVKRELRQELEAIKR